MRPDIWASGRRIRQAGEGGTVPNLLALFGVKRPWMPSLTALVSQQTTTEWDTLRDRLTGSEQVATLAHWENYG
jgi:hypothetical protein